MRRRALYSLPWDRGLRRKRRGGPISVISVGAASCLLAATVGAGATGGHLDGTDPHRRASTVPGMVKATDPGCNAAVVERTAWLMGTTLRARVCAASREDAVEAIDDAFDRVRDLESRLSTWRPDSELTRLNNTPPGRWVSLSSETAELLAEVRRWIEITGGAFDPAVGAAIDSWDMRAGGRRPTAGELDAARDATGPGAWQLRPEIPGARARRSAGVRLDAGAFGKGAGLRLAAAELKSATLQWMLLDFGGQLVLRSRDPTDRWTIGVADPRRRDHTALRLRVGSASIATTGTSERAVHVDGERLGHVIDPRTARPVEAWGSVTVVTPDPLAADVLSTALFVLGRDAALRWSGPDSSSEAGVLVLESTESGPKPYPNDRLDEFASIDSPYEKTPPWNRGILSHDI